jgi:hypothetical protein
MLRRSFLRSLAGLFAAPLLPKLPLKPVAATYAAMTIPFQHLPTASVIYGSGYKIVFDRVRLPKTQADYEVVVRNMVHERRLDHYHGKWVGED